LVNADDDVRVYDVRAKDIAVVVLDDVVVLASSSSSSSSSSSRRVASEPRSRAL